MTVRMHFLYQALMLILQALNYVSPMTPMKAKPWVAFGFTVCQAALGLYNHFFTPAGTRIPPVTQ